jgi:hypothetical protein
MAEETKAKRLKVDAAKFEAIINELGLQRLDQAGFVQVLGPKGRKVYVARTKLVGRVDIAGFEMHPPMLGVKDLRGESFGAVKQQLDFGGAFTEEQVLTAFRSVLELMKSLPPAEKVKKEFKPRMPGSAAAPSPGKPLPEVLGNAALLLPIGKLTAEQKDERRKLIEETARKYGTQVSQRTAAELGTEA